MRRLRALRLFAALVLISCGKIPTNEIPPLDEIARTPPPVVGPVSLATPSPAPAPSGSPTPTPSPGASPTPTPTPAPSPAGSSCRLPAMPECGAPEGPSGVFGCCRRADVSTSVFMGPVDEAIAQLQRDQPQLFDGNRPRDANAYVQGVARILEQRYGLCARQGAPEDEVAVKSSNGFSEQFDILFSNGAIRPQGFVVQCSPARF